MTKLPIGVEKDLLQNQAYLDETYGHAKRVGKARQKRNAEAAKNIVTGPQRLTTEMVVSQPQQQTDQRRGPVMDRGTFLRLAFVVAVTTACNPLGAIEALLSDPTPASPPQSTPNITRAPATATAVNTRPAVATATRVGRNIEDVGREAGFRVDLKDAHPNYPRSHEEAAAAISAGGAHPVEAAQMYPALDKDGVFRGWWTYEAFEFQDGVKFDKTKGIHVDASGHPLTDKDQIYNFKRPLPVEKFADIKLNVPFAGVWAARRGLTRDGQPPQTYYYTGTQGTGAQAIEQAMLIPGTKDLCPDDWNLSAVTRAYRMAVGAFRDDPATRDGFDENGQKRFIDVKWFNTIDKAWTSLDGRLVRRLAIERGKDSLSIIDKLVPNWPINPNEVTKRIGGLASKWFMDLRTFEWFFEAFPFVNGVKYEDGVGHVGQDGRLIVGAENAGRGSRIFNFDAPPESMASYMYGPRTLAAWSAVRTGNDERVKQEDRNQTFVTYGNGDVIFDRPSIEQVNITPLPPGCPTGDIEDQKQSAVKTVAVEKNRDPLVKVFYWKIREFLFLPKASRTTITP